MPFYLTVLIKKDSIFLMRYFIYFLFVVLTLFSCRGIFYKKTHRSSTSEKSNKWIMTTPPPIMTSPILEFAFSTIPTPPELMNKPIKEIQFYTSYRPKPTEKEKKRVIESYQNCVNTTYKNNPEFCKHFSLNEHRLRFEGKSYCYEIKKDKESLFKKNLKARLYDKEGNILAEDYLRCDRNLDGTETCDKQSTPSLNFYLPYSKKAYKIQVVEIEDGKEIILNEKQLLSYNELKNSKTYYKGSFCHLIQIAPIM